VPLQAAVYRGLTNKTGPGQLDSPKSLSLPLIDAARLPGVPIEEVENPR
jgi:hypothetical protein